MPNQGQIWSSRFQIGREAVAGVPVPATRKGYFETASVLSVQQASNEHRFSVGRRDNLLDITPGPVEAGGTLSLPASASELVELMLISLQGGVTPTLLAGSTNVNRWVFKPSTNLDSMTVEWDDGANLWQGAGARGNQLTFTGDASGTNIVSCELFSNDTIILPGGVLTTGLADRVPDFLEGWQTRLFIGSFGQAFDQLLNMPGLLRNWTITIANALGRVRTADNTLGTRRITTGELAVTATMTFDAYGAGAIAEFSRWRANQRLAVGLEFVGSPSGIEAGANETQTLTFGTQTSGTWLPSFMGVPGTVPIAWNATAAQTQTALQSIPTVGPGDLTVTGGPAPTTPMVVAFGGRWSEYNVQLLTANTALLLGGTPSVSIVQTVAGKSGRRRIQVLLPGKWTSPNIGGSADNIRTYEMALTAIYDPVLAAMSEIVLENERLVAFAA